jgi:hypothetical protein
MTTATQQNADVFAQIRRKHTRTEHDMDLVGPFHLFAVKEQTPGCDASSRLECS